MVFFGTNYEAYISDEYGVTSYFNYENLKNLIHVQEDEKAEVPFDRHKRNFFDMFEDELGRLDEIFESRLIDYEYMFVDCQRLGKALKSYEGSKSGRKTQEASLKRNLTVLYRKLTQLETYRLLNNTLVIKISKKFDKVHKDQKRPVFDTLMSKLHCYRIGNGTKLQNLSLDVEKMYADFFCDGLLEEAKGKLTLAKGEHRPKLKFFLATKIGVLFTLMAWFFSDVSSSEDLLNHYLKADDPSVYVYAFVACLIIYRWIWGFNVYMWDSVGIDYILLLDLDAKKSNIKPSYDQIFSEAANYSIFYFVNILTFHAIKASNDTVNEDEYSRSVKYAYILPTMLVLGVICTAIWNCRHISYGVFSISVFLHLLSTPFTIVTFRHTYAADILTSFTKVMGFAAYTGCYYISGTYVYAANKGHDYGADKFERCESTGMHAVKTILYLAPLYMRFMQNMRQQYDSIQRRKRELKNEASKVIPTEENEIEGDKTEGEDNSVRDFNEDVVSRKHRPRAKQNLRDTLSHSESFYGSLPKVKQRLASLATFDSAIGAPICQKVRNFIFSHLLIWPYSYNALKYFLAMMVVIFGSYPPVDPEETSFKCFYLTLACIATMYATYWDFKNDWGLFHLRSPKPLLREPIYYGKTEYLYYIILFFNPIFRSFWTLSFTPYGHHPFLACFEIFRRSLWACLRMELAYIAELNKRARLR